jgi:hypothetical protein
MLNISDLKAEEQRLLGELAAIRLLLKSRGEMPAQSAQNVGPTQTSKKSVYSLILEAVELLPDFNMGEIKAYVRKYRPDALNGTIAAQVSKLRQSGKLTVASGTPEERNQRYKKT